MKTLIKTGVFDVLQVPMSLIRIERVEEEILSMAAEYDMGVVVNFPTADGLLARDAGIFQPLFDDYVTTPCQTALLALLLHQGVSSVLSGMSTPTIVDENCAVGSIIADMPEGKRAALRRRVETLGIGPCRSCGRCAPYTHEIPVQQIMTYHDAEYRFGLRHARQRYEGYRDRAMACTSSEGADAVCPEGFDVLAEVQRCFQRME